MQTAKSWFVFLNIAAMVQVSFSEDDFHSILGKAIYTPKEDLLGSIPNGITFFKDIPDHCLRKVNQATTVKHQSFYKNTGEFYKSLATQTKLKASYESHFTLGFTLDVTTKTVSGRKRSVKGTSLNLATKAYELQFSPNCLYETALQSRVLTDLAALNTKISSPWYKSSWRKYQTFLETHGSHVITAVTYGSSIDQYAFAEESSSYTARQFTVKACAELAANSPASTLGKVGVSACSGVTRDEISKISNTRMTSSITVRGGTPTTRNTLLHERSNDLIRKFLDEGQTHATPIEYTLTPIWQILRRHNVMVSRNANAYVQSVNMQYYFDGYLNFGCAYNPGTRGPPIQKFDHARHSTADNPVFECTLAPPGCHHHDDCHYHIGVWCNCRGPSCIHHSVTKLSTGVTRKIAKPYYGDHWGWNGCDWTLWGSICGCIEERTSRVKIFP